MGRGNKVHIESNGVLLVRFRRILAAGELVFNPYTHLHKQIRSAANDIGSYFDDIDSAIEDGDSVKSVVRKRRIQGSMQQIIHSARLTGFQIASKHGKKRMPLDYGLTVGTEARARAKKVDRQMYRTTKTVLRNSPDSGHILSEGRAIAAARYEAANSFFAGVHDALQGSGYLKAWYTSIDDSCDECIANEDQGPIEMDEDFESGDSHPAAHLNCSCGITAVRE